MQVKDVMTKNVVCVTPQDTVEKAAKLMNDYNIGSIPVCEGKKVVGIITDRDIVLRCVSQSKDTKQFVADCMTRNPVTADPYMDVNVAAKMMSERQIRRLPIIDNNNLVGMVALGDFAVQPNLKDNAGEALKDISAPTNNNMF